MNRLMDCDCPACGEPRTLTQNATEAHDGTWVCTQCSTEIFGFMDCPLCGEPDGLTKRVNEDHDSVGVHRMPRRAVHLLVSVVHRPVAPRTGSRAQRLDPRRWLSDGHSHTYFERR